MTSGRVCGSVWMRSDPTRRSPRCAERVYRLPCVSGPPGLVLIRPQEHILCESLDRQEIKNLKAYPRFREFRAFLISANKLYIRLLGASLLATGFPRTPKHPFNSPEKQSYSFDKIICSPGFQHCAVRCRYRLKFLRDTPTNIHYFNTIFKRAASTGRPTRLFLVTRHHMGY